MPKFLIEQPATHDDLQTHSRVADALATAINDDRRLRYIGVLGRWGSGKSSVVEMFEKQLKTHDDSWLIFKYDAWTHQSDPPRRSFLEKFDEFLTEEIPSAIGDKDNKKWRKNIRQLSLSVDTLKTKTRPKLSTAGKALIASLIFTPLGLKMIGSATPRAGIFFLEMSPTFTLGWLLCLAPILVSAWFGIVGDSRGKKHDPLSLLSNKITERRFEVKTKNVEPTAIEFQNMLAGAVEFAVKNGKKLVFVIDNLDRLPSKEAITLWGAIRGMFLGSEFKSLNLEQRPVVVLPIDDKAVSEIYKLGGSEGETASAFLDKTFDAVFRVPPPVLSRWHNYMSKMLKEAFESQISDNTISDIISIVDRSTRSDFDKVTPRYINKIVNSLVTLYLQWDKDDISLTSMAYYVTNSHHIDKNVVDFVTNKSNDLDSLDDNWKQSIAAMYFGVPPMDAFQVMLQKPIVQALYDGSDKDFRTLAAFEGFGAQFNRTLSDIPRDEIDQSIFTAVELLGALPTQDAPWIVRSWSTLNLIMRSTAYGGAISPRHVRAILNLIGRLPTAEGDRLVLEEWNRIPFRSRAAKLEDTGELLNLIEALLAEGASRKLTLRTLQIDSAASYEMILAHEPGASVIDAIAFDGPLEGVASQLQERLKSLPRAHGAPPAIRGVAQKFGSDFPWGGVSTIARENVASEEFERAQIGFLSLFAMSQVFPGAGAAIRELVAEGPLQRLASAPDQLTRPTSEIAQLLGALVVAESSPGFTVQTIEKLIGEGAQFVDQFNSAVSYADVTWSGLIRTIESRPELLPLIRMIASSWISAGHGLDIPVDLMKSSAPALTRLFDEADAPSFYKTLTDRDDFWAAISRQTLGTLKPLLLALISNEQTRKSAAKKLQKALGEIDAAWLKQVIQTGAGDYTLIADASVSAYPEGSLQEVIRTAAREDVLASGDQAFRTRWFHLSRVSKPAHRKVLYRTLLDRLAAGTPVVDAPGLLNTGGEALLIEGYIPSIADGLTRHVLQPMLASDEGKAWLLANAEWTAIWVGDSTPETRSTLRDQIGAMGETGKRIGSALGAN